jgi:photosystem II stability/assembly factor-like uncharacterized protein
MTSWRTNAMPRDLRRVALSLSLLAAASSAVAQQTAWVPAQPDAIGGPWSLQGPGPSHNGQLEGIPNRPVTGAINGLAAHPTNPDILYLGAVNGGLWRTTNATSATPVWTPLTDALSSLSIGRDALQFDPTDPTRNTLVAGSGRSSSFSSNGGARIGMLRTTDGGTTWTVLAGAGGTLAGRNATGVAARGSVLMMSVNNFNGGTADVTQLGIFRSTDTGATFTRVSGSGGLPLGRTFDLAADPSNNAIFYTSVSNAGAGNGVYKSTDTGATWARVSDATINALVTDGATNNMKISVGLADNVFVAVCNSGAVAGIFRSGNGGSTWTSLTLPSPTIHPGGQSSLHLSFVASRANPNVVFIGGDRQNTPFPNDVGAVDFSGRLFRIDAGLAPASQAQHLTHSSALGGPGGGTANNSAPHADSRVMVIDANGDVIEGDDGGVYKRTVPGDNTGVWVSLIGNLAGTEFHGIAFDSNTDTVLGGTQDNGTPQQQVPDNQVWSSISTADGGDVSVDDITTPGLSVRFSSFQFLGSFRRRTYNAANVLRSTQTPTLTVTSGAPFSAQFYTPVKVNERVGTRVILGGANGAYESLNRGDTLVQLSTNSVARNAIAYGGRRLGVDNPDVLYVGSGAQVLVRTTSGGLLAASAYPGGGAVAGIALNPEDWQEAVVANAAGLIHRTTDAGATWSNITHNLAALNPGVLRSVSYVQAGPNAALVGTDRGVFALLLNTTTWDSMGTALPNAPVFELDYDVSRDKLTAGLLGRGSWILTPVAPHVPVELQSFEIR